MLSVLMGDANEEMLHFYVLDTFEIGIPRTCVFCFVLFLTFPFVIKAPAELEAIKSCLSDTGEAEPFSEWLLQPHDDG